MVIAYLRVSTSKQHLVNQQDEIRRFAHTKEIEVSRWVTEIVSGKKNQKERKLGRVINQLKPGDTLIVTEISRLSRTLSEIMDIMGKSHENTITIKKTQARIEFDNTKTS
uniref:recombinase family protein n=1 Tax=Barnesiella intestinihominis TaxID=487174 RepID=UPI003FEDDC40